MTSALTNLAQALNIHNIAASPRLEPRQEAPLSFHTRSRLARRDAQPRQEEPSPQSRRSFTTVSDACQLDTKWLRIAMPYKLWFKDSGKESSKDSGESSTALGIEEPERVYVCMPIFYLVQIPFDLGKLLIGMLINNIKSIENNMYL